MSITTIVPTTLSDNGEGVAELQGSGFLVTDASVLDMTTLPATGDVTYLSGNTIARLTSDSASAILTLPYDLPEVFDVTIGMLYNDALSAPPYGDHYMAYVSFTDTGNPLNSCIAGVYHRDGGGITFRLETDSGVEEISSSLDNIKAMRLLKTPTKMILRVIRPDDSEEDRISITYSAALSTCNISVNSMSSYINVFDISGVAYSSMVFIEDYPQSNVVINDDTSVDFNVTEMNTDTYGLKLFLQDLTIYDLAGVEVIEAFVQKQESFNTDIAITTYGDADIISFQKLFSDRDGFKWDEDYFSTDDLITDNNRIPVLWDPQIAGIALTMFKSGIGFGRDVQLKGIRKFYRNNEIMWLPVFNHGHYYESVRRLYLYSNESIIDKIGSLETEDGRSLVNLKYSPKPGIPITIATFRYDTSNSIVPLQQFTQTGKFRGIVTTGKEADTADSPESIDPTHDEFMLIRNEDYIVRNFHLGYNIGPGEVTIDLPYPVIDRCFPIHFSRIDIFTNQKPMGTFYNQGVYGQFRYGQPLTEPGDWSVSYEEGVLKVLLDHEVPDLGFISYHRDYPAKVEFARKIFSSAGLGIETPTLLNLDQMDKIGVVSGAAGQIFNLSKGFPTVDDTTFTHTDTLNFKLFLFNTNTSNFETDWTRVLNIADHGPTDKVYTFDSDIGEVQFGDGIHGKIPNKYLVVYAVYLPVPRIEYEPEIASDDFIGNVNLAPENVAAPAGVLSVSSKQIVPAFLTLNFATKAILSNEFSVLAVRVFGSLNEPVHNQDVDLTIIEGTGSLREYQVTTNLNGYQETVFFPDKSSNSVGVPAYFNDIGEVGTPNISEDIFFSIDQPNDALRFTSDLLSPLEDVYFFKIIDDPDDIEGLRFDFTDGTGGRYEAMIDGAGDPIRAIEFAGDIAIFDASLEQGHDPAGPNYNSKIVGYVAVSKYTVKVQASLKFGNIELKSNTAIVTVDLPITERGEYTIPTLPFNFDSSTIDRATYLNPS